MALGLLAPVSAALAAAPAAPAAPAATVCTALAATVCAALAATAPAPAALLGPPVLGGDGVLGLEHLAGVPGATAGPVPPDVVELEGAWADAIGEQAPVVGGQGRAAPAPLALQGRLGS